MEGVFRNYGWANVAGGLLGRRDSASSDSQEDLATATGAWMGRTGKM